MKTPNIRFGLVREFDPEEVAETRTIDFVISDESKDRHRTVLDIEGWDIDSYNRNGIVGYQHNLYGDMCNAPDPEDVIAKGSAFVEGRLLIGRTTFADASINPKSDRIFRMVQTGFLKSTSVGFNPLEKGVFGEGEQREGGKDETYYFGKRELLEYSVVNIPSNRNAQVRTMRDNTASALLYVRRELDSKYSLSQIENMSIRTVLDLLDGKQLEIRHTDPETVSKQLRELELQSARFKRMFESEKLRNKFTANGH